MDPETSVAVWSSARRPLIYYDINLLASLTGLRMGECLALHADDIHHTHITIAHSWNIKYGEGGQKTKRGTDLIPIPRFLADRLLSRAYICKAGDYLFSLTDGKRPATANRCNDALIDALKKIGISDDLRQKRKLSFHSWRAFANTYFRNQGVPDSKVRAITRHETEAMTEHYTAWREEDFREVADAQARLIAEIGGAQNGISSGLPGAVGGDAGAEEEAGGGAD